MTTVPDYVHDAHTVHLKTGLVRWDAYCPCGWRWAGLGGKEDAEYAARAHNGDPATHTCYDPQTAEYGPTEDCPACIAAQSTAREIGEYLTEQPLEADTERAARIHARDRGDSYRRGRSSR